VLHDHFRLERLFLVIRRIVEDSKVFVVAAKGCSDRNRSVVDVVVVERDGVTGGLSPGIYDLNGLEKRRVDAVSIVILMIRTYQICIRVVLLNELTFPRSSRHFPHSQPDLQLQGSLEPNASFGETDRTVRECLDRSP
jgi:hypothetical protein